MSVQRIHHPSLCCLSFSWSHRQKFTEFLVDRLSERERMDIVWLLLSTVGLVVLGFVSSMIRSMCTSSVCAVWLTLRGAKTALEVLNQSLPWIVSEYIFVIQIFHFHYHHKHNVSSSQSLKVPSLHCGRSKILLNVWKCIGSHCGPWYSGRAMLGNSLLYTRLSKNHTVRTNMARLLN